MRALLFYLLRTYNGVTIYPNDVHAPPPLPKCGGVTVLAYKLLYENRYAMTFGGRNTLKKYMEYVFTPGHGQSSEQAHHGYPLYLPYYLPEHCPLP